MEIIIVGAGGFAKEIAFLLARLPEHELVGFVDDNYDSISKKVYGKPVIGPVEILERYQKRIGVVIGIAKPAIKKRIYQQLSSNPNLVYPNLIDSNVLLGYQVTFGVGNVVMANSTFTADIQFGDFNMINIGSTIGHDTAMGDFNTLYPTINVSGNVRIGNENEIGVGTKIIQGIRIGDQNIIGAGTVLIRDADNRGKYVGVPAKEIESW
ncbi:acetyltransferase [Enterococcus xiangfangensis]|uniref:acetyltransferase n=1 Tax=Enterococcus xiangfangensis TaxID=1296537 RepID=UPI0010FA1D8C|nr:acetyltransferase [Enterococcus xiangfangensis]MBM7712987.1 sugar O-acyltransferase (sialic acid O-acetyltransferase NeuD family) [Enterococcus xiangfangensis]